MNFNEKVDFALLALYRATRERGMVSLRQTFHNHGLELSETEARDIKELLALKKLAVFQVERYGLETDYRGSILPDGIKFTEGNSFSEPGTSIVELEEPE